MLMERPAKQHNKKKKIYRWQVGEAVNSLWSFSNYEVTKSAKSDLV